ncbi:MAG: hypothetical protein WAT39_14500 [Planctomycetota bacterium]
MRVLSGPRWALRNAEHRLQYVVGVLPECRRCCGLELERAGVLIDAQEPYAAVFD